MKSTHFLLFFFLLINILSLAQSYRKLSFTEKTVESFCDDVKQYAGYIQAAPNKNLFYWFFEARYSPQTAPLTIWLTGGPGCSSLLALFYENGPCTITNDLNTKINPYSWNNNSNIMWIDQPVNVGFSYGSPNDHDEVGVAEDMYGFLQAWLAAHPEYQKNPFFVTGESYGGHYVPAVAARIHRGNLNDEAPININLQGIAIGNGLTDPEIQYQWYAEFAYNNTVKRLISLSTYDQMKRRIPRCIQYIHDCNNGGDNECETALQFCNAAFVSPIQATGINLYDIREPCRVAPLCYDFSNLDKFLALQSTREKLGVGDNEWHGDCNYYVNADFTGDWMKNYQGVLPALLASNISVLIYVGEVDFICNFKGNKAWTLDLDWPGKSGFNAEKDRAWVVGGTEAGLVRSYNSFTFLQVHASGHMVPMDQPIWALTLINTFFNKVPF